MIFKITVTMLLTLILLNSFTLIFLGTTNVEGPAIKVVFIPTLSSAKAISYPCFPLDLLVINLTGSIYSLVGPAVTIALNLFFGLKFSK